MDGSVIFAINNGISFTALSYEHKISGLLELLNLQKYMIDLSFFLAKDKTDLTPKIFELKTKINTIVHSNEFYKPEQESLQARRIACSCKNVFISFTNKYII